MQRIKQRFLSVWCTGIIKLFLQLSLFSSSSSRSVVVVAAMATLSSKVVTIVGGGSVGSALGIALLKSGKAKDVLIAARDPVKTAAKLTDEGKSNLKVEALASAIASADILILATPSVHDDTGLKELAISLGDVAGKYIVDATNPLTAWPGLEIRWEQGTSAGEKLAEYLPSAKVYKAFNTLGVEHMIDPVGKDMLYCGEDKDGIEELIAAIGYKPCYVGPIRYARNLEAIAELWIHCAIPPLPAQYIGRDWTFAIAGNPEK
jgi:8-hydroxy-5-deazaflavin:NADPH oxidoreductase